MTLMWDFCRVVLFAILAMAAMLPATLAESDATYGINGDMSSSKDGQQAYCAAIGGELAVDYSRATHETLTQSIYSWRPTGEYFAYLGGSTTASTGCPAPQRRQASLICVWYWETALFKGEKALAFYRGNLHPIRAPSGDGLAGAGSIGTQPTYWGTRDGVPNFPGNHYEQHLVLASWDQYKGVWADAPTVGGFPYSPSGHQPFLSLCRFDESSGTGGAGSSSQSASTGNRSRLSRAALTGIIVGSVLGAVLLIVVIVIIARRCCSHSSRASRASPSPDGMSGAGSRGGGGGSTRQNSELSRNSSAGVRAARHWAPGVEDNASIDSARSGSGRGETVPLSRNRRAVGWRANEAAGLKEESLSETSSTSSRPPRPSLTDVDKNGPLRYVSVEDLRQSLSSGGSSRLTDSS